MIVPGSKYLLAILNSHLADWYIRQLGVSRNGGYFEYKPMFVEKLPVPVIEKYEQEEFIKYIDKLLQNKKNNINTFEIENKIDEMVYQLYGLSDEEKRFLKNQ